jgi:hypothetical protein
VAAGRVLSEEELAALIDDALDPSWSGLASRPLPAVLDTDFIRTGLHFQLSNGFPPRSVQTAREGSIRLFMEYDTLTEAQGRLPRFARQFGVPEAELRQIINADWLPHVDVVKLPAALRQADPRALLVRDRDADDYPAAALAALLSPCLLLTRNYKHFGVLGVLSAAQAVDGVMAVGAIQVGETHVQAVVMIPGIPARAATAGMKWAIGRIGPWAWVITAAATAGGIWWFCRQPPERREKIVTVARQVGTHLLDEYGRGAEFVLAAQRRLRGCVVPRPEQRTIVSAIVREMAMSAEALSAQQLAGLLDSPVRPQVAELRAFLRQHDDTVFRQVRQGGFVLGSHYELPG